MGCVGLLDKNCAFSSSPFRIDQVVLKFQN